MPHEVPLVLSDISDTSIRTNYVGFASFAMLIWDHIDTFVDEVEYIWKGKKKGIFIYLFLFNRYFTPFTFIISLYAYLSPFWTFDRFGTTQLQGCTFAIAVEVVGVMMLLRVNALYPHQKWISGGLALLLIFQTVMFGWLISHGQPVPHNPNSGLHACFLVFDPALSSVVASAPAWMPLLYDTIVFGLTLYRTVPHIWREEASHIMKRLLEDGVLYYSVIFSVSFVLTFMIVVAPQGTKDIAAQTEQLVTVAMMSRITINLRRAGDPSRDDPTLSIPEAIRFAQGQPDRWPSSAHFLGRPFDMRIPDSEATRPSTDQTSTNTTEGIAERSSFSRAGCHNKRPPLVVAPSEVNSV